MTNSLYNGGMATKRHRSGEFTAQFLRRVREARKLETGETATKRWVLRQVIEPLSFGPTLRIKYKPPTVY